MNCLELFVNWTYSVLKEIFICDRSRSRRAIDVREDAIPGFLDRRATLGFWRGFCSMLRFAVVFVFILGLSSALIGQLTQERRISQGPRSDPFAITAGTSFSASAASARVETNKSGLVTSSIVNDVEEALSIVDRFYVNRKTIDQKDLTKSSINSMLKSLDPHSNYFDPAEYQELIGEERSEYFGTGSTIVSYERNRTLETYVISTFPGSSSQLGGMRYGDRIISVNGKDVRDSSSLEIRDMIRGPLGTSVSVGIDRSGQKLSFVLKRDRVPQPTVTDAFMLGNGVAMIAMPEGFSFTTSSEFDTALRRLKKAGMKSLIIDLRGNPGGILDQSIKIAERFLPAGSLIVSQKGRTPIDNRIWRSNNRNPETVPLVLLVNSDTASASEVLAGALQDNDRALIVGERTFGKGLVQSVLDLPDGTGLALTTAKYFTPSGRSIQRDYSKTGVYDYFSHNSLANPAERQEAVSYTVGKRPVFGGDGIAPDVKSAGEPFDGNRAALLDPLFYFGLELANEGIADIHTISEETVSRFASFAENGWGIKAADTLEERGFVKLRLEYNLILEAEGPEAARQFLLSTDPETVSAIDSIPQAAAFVDPIRRDKTLSRK